MSLILLALFGIGFWVWATRREWRRLRYEQRQRQQRPPRVVGLNAWWNHDPMDCGCGYSGPSEATWYRTFGAWVTCPVCHSSTWQPTEEQP